MLTTLLYELVIRLFSAAVAVAAPFNAKARQWVDGRRNWRRRCSGAEKTGQKTLWVHAASLGEFEQGRPIIESFRARYPDWRIVLSFFSPSGYEIRKNYPHADLVCYLPADTRRNAADFVELIRPDAAVFIKYEFWANYLGALKRRGVPTLLVSALFRDSQPFFRWYGAFWRRMLACFSHIFVQNEHSGELLRKIGFGNVTVAGDTRVDRVLKLAADAPENGIAAAFAGDRTATRVLVAGSTWPADEAIILPALGRLNGWKTVIAPHDPSGEAVRRLERSAERQVRTSVLCYSQADTAAAAAGILIVDNVGLLNTLYRYGTVAYIGGGFGKGIHNTLEPAAFGLPVIFGPKYEKFEEARQFVARGGAFCVRNADELSAILEKLEEPSFYRKASEAVRGYLEESRGATERILSFFTQIQGENP